MVAASCLRSQVNPKYISADIMQNQCKRLVCDELGTFYSSKMKAKYSANDDYL